MTDTVVELPKLSPKKHSTLADTGSFHLNQTAHETSFVRSRPAHGSAAVLIDIDHLYPKTDGPTPHLVQVLEILGQAIGVLEQARSTLRGNPMESDRTLLRFPVLLRDLFKYRGIGDGFGLIVNSLHFALINQRGKPLNFDQVTTIWRIVKELRTKPVLSFDEALNYVEELEEVRLEVDPSILSELVPQPNNE
jgi:hypothetical protein